ncbi:MAG: hypothetical protein K6F32_06565 [Bacilli bacterium]|nr:hypothetical protein [Bacilli bacterium]
MKARDIKPNSYRTAMIIVAGLMAVANVILAAIVMITAKVVETNAKELLPIRYTIVCLPVAITLLVFSALNYFSARKPENEAMFDLPYFRSKKSKIIDTYLVLSIIASCLCFGLAVLFMAGAFGSGGEDIAFWLFIMSWFLPHLANMSMRITDMSLGGRTKSLVLESILAVVLGIAFPITGFALHLGFGYPIALMALAAVPVYYLVILSNDTGKEGDIPLESDD